MAELLFVVFLSLFLKSTNQVRFQFQLGRLIIIAGVATRDGKWEGGGVNFPSPRFTVCSILRSDSLPVPQVVEQAPHPVHEDTTQSLGQQLCVHGRICREAGHGELQYGWETTERV